MAKVLRVQYSTQSAGALALAAGARRFAGQCQWPSDLDHTMRGSVSVATPAERILTGLPRTRPSMSSRRCRASRHRNIGRPEYDVARNGD